MYRKLILNDIRKSKLTTFTIAAFLFLSALLTCTAASLAVTLVNAIDFLMVEAKTPHFMQMHTGDVGIERLSTFANADSNIADWQVLEFLNLDGSYIQIETESLSDSIQDNGLAVQSGQFDYLLDLEGNIPVPADDEIYVPIYYMKEYDMQAGDTVTICGVPFTVAGFIRDSQMNSAMISSKRFLVSAASFDRFRELGSLESLIEFRFYDDSSLGTFESTYLATGLESNGPSAVTYPLIRLANGITDGIMIAVLLLISILVMLVAFLCIRFTLLAKIEEDFKEIGVLKAIGLRISSIKRLYLAKYGMVAAVACFLGFLCSLLLGQPLAENIRLYMGGNRQPQMGLLFGLCGAILIFGAILLYVNGVLNRFRKLSASQAIRFGAPQEQTKSSRRFRLSQNRLLSTNAFLGVKDILARKKLYVTMLLVLIISTFIMIVPQNIYSTMASRGFMTYMGIGECDMRMDIQQTEQIPGKTAAIESQMADDDRIASYTVLTSYMFELPMEDGSSERLKVELGDHDAFPITYSKGRAPQLESEIALSVMVAEELTKAVGDTLVLIVDGSERTLTVCGVYSDVTDGGRTAKAVFETNEADILWSTIPVRLHDREQLAQTLFDYKALYPFAKVSNIDDYIYQSFGTATEAIRRASYTAVAAAILLSFLLTALFIKLLITKDRHSIAILKVNGFASRAVQKQYIVRSVTVLILGLVIGTVLANTLGELAGVAIISSFGASTFHFEVNPLFAYLLSPLLIAVCVSAGTLLGIAGIKRLRIPEQIKE